MCAAHGGIGRRVPVGGGAAVAHALLRAWARQQSFDVTLLGLGAGRELGTALTPQPVLRPTVDSPFSPAETGLGDEFGGGQRRKVGYERLAVALLAGRDPDELVALNELQYARLCRDFERAATARILDRAHDGLVVVANDISEGPDVARLAAAGIPVMLLWHVDVVDYFCRFYLQGLDPAAAMRAWRGLGVGSRYVPDVLRLVFEKQSAALAHAAAHVVPSAPMRDIIGRCFPGAAERVHVVPWGAWLNEVDRADLDRERAALVAELGLRDGEPVLLTLSRISPEKGLERVIEALRLGEHRDEVPTGLRLLIAGEAAFMQGQRYRAELVRRAATLTQARIEFVGYASGARKAALLDLADLFIFPSRHESYGLTLAEALQAGRPVISTAHYSARELVQDAGIVVPNVPEGWVPEALWAAIRRMLGDPGLRRTMAAAAGRRAAGLSFDRAASRIARLARSLAERRPDLQA